LQRGDLTEAEQWWIKCGLPDLSEMITLEQYPYHIFEYLALTQAWFLLAWEQDTGRPGDLQQASEILETLPLEAERFQRLTSKIEILVLQAMAQEAQENERAKDTFLHALALGEPQGCHGYT
jgi:hypothetical protein